MVRTLLFLLVVVFVALIAVVFAWLNPGTISLDLAFGKFDVLKSLAFALTLAVGWALGLVSALAYLLKVTNERRKLRKAVRLAEAELSNLRSLPLHDAG